MRVWLYARLSNDDDREMNSLLNQQEICQAFAEQHGYIIVGQSFDDNISGMSFDRRGLDELMVAVDADKIDAVIVKDISPAWPPIEPRRIVHRLSAGTPGASDLCHGGR